MTTHEPTRRPSIPAGPRSCPRCGAVYPWAVWTCTRDGARLIQRSDDLVGQVVDHYQVIDELGAGGCGRVYRAIPTFAEQWVALKVLHAGADPVRTQRFRREALALRAIRHPNVVAVLDFGVTREGREFMVMEHVRGRTLRAELGGRPLPPPRAAQMVRGVALALQAVHDAGLLHRDVKPSNVMVHGDRVKLIDFGVVGSQAYGAVDPITLPGHLAGTPRYMAPEQLAGNGGDPRSDLYALGATLYELLTGRAPFDGSLAELASQHASVPPPPMPVGVGELGELAMALLRKDPAQRPQTAREVAERLASHTDAATEAPRSEVAPSRAVAAGESRGRPLEAVQRALHALDVRSRLRRSWLPTSHAA